MNTYKKKNYEGVLPSVADLDYTPLVFSKYQQLRNGQGLRFEVHGAFRIGCFQLTWQLDAAKPEGQAEHQEGGHSKRVVLWLKGDAFVSVLEQLRNKRIAPVAGTYTDRSGASKNVYYKKDFMGSPANGNKKAESRAFSITDAASDRYVYTFTGKRVEGITGPNGTVSPKQGAIPTQLQAAMSQEEFWELMVAAKRMWYGYTSAQWSRTVIREELQKIFAEYGKFPQKSAVVQNAIAPQNQGIAQQPPVEPSTPAPAQQPVQPSETVVKQDEIIDYDDLPY